MPGDKPDLTKAMLPEGSAVVKILFTDAKAVDFDGPDILDGAPALSIYARDRSTGTKGLVSVRLLQLDFATRDKRAGKAQWTFGTFAYDAKAPGAEELAKSLAAADVNAVGVDDVEQMHKLQQSVHDVMVALTDSFHVVRGVLEKIGPSTTPPTDETQASALE